MAKVFDEILDSFFEKLADSTAVDEQMLKALQTLFQSNKKLKASDIVAVISGAAKGPSA